MATARKDGPELTSDQQQKLWFDEAVKIVAQQAFIMKRELDQHHLRKALVHANNMLNELRTSLLSPRNYYALYMRVMDEMTHLEEHFWEEYSQRGASVEDMYEIAQHAGNIVPRLYLLITVGSVYIRSKQAPARDILKDLAEMCKGVQHPTRGLFLRNYLLQKTKDKLPDVGSEYEGAGGTVNDAVDFILQNFHEMTKLWMRMQSQTYSSDKEKRERERMDLRILVGTNLVRLSNLDGVDERLYRESLLPRLTEQVLGHKDTITQQYLMESIIQVFPDEFHLSTLDVLLRTCMNLQAGVDLQNLAISLMDRLANYASENPSRVAAGSDIFQTFYGFVDGIVKRPTLVIDSVGILSLRFSQLNLALRCYPDRHDYVDTVMGLCVEDLQRAPDKVQHTPVVKLMVQILSVPVVVYKNALRVLGLANYLPLFELLPYSHRKSVALEYGKYSLKFGHRITGVEEVTRVFDYIRPLVRSEQDQPPDEELDEEFEEEQNVVARLVNLFDAPDPAVQFEILSASRRVFGRGTARRMVFTLPPLVFAYLRLAHRTHRAMSGATGAANEGGSGANGHTPDSSALQQVLDSVFQHLLETLEVLSKERAEQSLRLYLQCAMTADSCLNEKVAYDFMASAFSLYEEEISDSKTQLALLQLFVGTLGRMDHLSPENYDTLSTKTCQYSVKLLKKPDQCRAAYTCSHLFWKPTVEAHMNDGRVLECLKRSLTLADHCLSAQQFPLFVEILNRYLYHFEQGNDKLPSVFLTKLLELINTNISKDDEAPSEEGVQTHKFYQNTLKYIRGKQAKDTRYQDIAMTAT